MNIKFHLKLLFVCFVLLCCNKNFGQVHHHYLDKVLLLADTANLRDASKSLNPDHLLFSDATDNRLTGNHQNSRKKVELKSWTFIPIDSMGKLIEKKPIQIPHHFSKNRDYHAAWYIKKVYFQPKLSQRYILYLDQVMQFCKLYINGQAVGHHIGGLTPFEFDITDFLKSGENTIGLFVYDQLAVVEKDKAYSQLGVQRPWALKPEGGISRIPIIEQCAEVYLNDVFVITSFRKKELTLKIELQNASSKSQHVDLEFEILKWPTGQIENIELPKIVTEVNPKTLTTHEIKVQWENPALWSPENPNLYLVRIKTRSQQNMDILDTRFGFREFWIEDKEFILNGIPIRLRGESSYDNSNKNSIDFHRELLLLNKKLFGINATRLHAHLVTGDAVKGADEAGVLLINQSAIWSVMHSYYRLGGALFLDNTKQEFKEWVRRDRNSPSVVIWDVENEMLRISEDNFDWVNKLNEFIYEWDTTRPICNSGAGWYNDGQHMIHLHMQEQYTKILHDWKQKGNKPVIMGEFWVGGRGEARLPNSAEIKTMDQQFLEEAKNYQYTMLNMRRLGVSGIMPFRISATSLCELDNHPGKYYLDSTGKMIACVRPVEVTGKIKHALQPVTAFVWPRQDYINKAHEEKKIFVCNDSESPKNLTLSWGFKDKIDNHKNLILGPAEILEIPLILNPTSSEGTFIVMLKENETLVSVDSIFYGLVDPYDFTKLNINRNLLLYQESDGMDVSDKKPFEELGAIGTHILPSNPENEIFIIAPEQSGRYLDEHADTLIEFVKRGGRILCLKQNKFPQWAPINFPYSTAIQSSPHTYKAMGWENVNKDLFYSTYVPVLDSAHPVFNNIGSEFLNNWNEFDGRVSDNVFIRPSYLGDFSKGAWRTLASGTRREQITIGEVRIGDGVILFCQAHVLDNIHNPQANRLLGNMLTYLDMEDPWSQKMNVYIEDDFDLNEISSFIDSGELRTEKKKKGINKYDLLLAFNSTDINAIKRHAKAGGTALVLSSEISKMFEGIKLSQESKTLYKGTINSSHFLFTGVSSANFLSFDNPIKGYFKEFPQDAQIILNGFMHQYNTPNPDTYIWRKYNDAGPIAISLKYGKGEIILTTLEPWRLETPYDKELLLNLLANAGINFKYQTKAPESYRILKTVPLDIDGSLADWTNDMEDRFVNQFVHAQPLFLKAENELSGNIFSDNDLSGIVYMLWNSDYFFVSGAIFKNENFYNGFRLNLHVGNELIEIEQMDTSLVLKVNSEIVQDFPWATGSVASGMLPDAQHLDFRYMHKSGKLLEVESKQGFTFELGIPWYMLSAINPKNGLNSTILLQLMLDNFVIQSPNKANFENKEHWHKLYTIDND